MTNDALFAGVLVGDFLVFLALLCLAFPELYRAPLRAYGQLRTALLFMQPLGFGRDVSKHPLHDVENGMCMGRRIPPPPPLTEREEQRRSFAYGNAAMSNPRVTREMIDRAAERLEAESPPCRGHSPRAPSTKTTSKVCIAGDGSPCNAHQHVSITQTGFSISPTQQVVHIDASWDDDVTPTSPKGAA
jgi:hypothetical protein